MSSVESVVNLALWHPLLRPFIKAVCLLYIPYLLGFILKSYEILHSSALHIGELGACPIPPTPNTQAEPSRTPRNDSKSTEWLVYEIFLVLRCFVLLEIGVLQWVAAMENFVPPQFKQILLNITPCFMFASLVFAVLRSAFQMSDMFARHLGQSTEQKSRSVVNLDFGISFFFLSMVVGLSENSTFCVCVVALALVYFASGGHMGKMPRWRHMFRYWACHSLAVLLIVYNLRQFFTVTQSQDGIGLTITFQGLYVSFLPTAISSYYSGNLIARMLRYDFMNYVGEPEPGIGRLDKTVEPPEVIVAPASSPTRFPKPYFTVAIVTWSFIRITTIVLCLATELPFKNPYDACFIAVVIEFPAMTAAVFLLGIVRGEAEDLWNYEERWIPARSSLVKEVMAKINHEKV